MKRTLETIKSFVLVLLFLISILISASLWLYQPPALTLPAELAGTASVSPPGKVPTDWFRPTALIYHDGQGSHTAVYSDEAVGDLMVAHQPMLSTLDSDHFQARPAEAGIEAGLFRRQMREAGVTIFLASDVPLNLYLESLGASGDFPDIKVDRLIFMIPDKSPGMLELHIRTEDGWLETSWSLMRELEEYRPAWEDRIPLLEIGSAGGELHQAARLVRTIEQQLDYPGQPVVLLPYWRDVQVSPLLAISSLDLQVETSVAQTAQPDPERFFPDFGEVRIRDQIDGRVTYSDGFRRLEVHPDGAVNYQVLAPTDDQSRLEPFELNTALLRASDYLKGVLGSDIDRLRLRGIETRPSSRESPEGDEGNEVEAFTFIFAQRYQGQMLNERRAPLSVTVDRSGIQSANIHLFEFNRNVQRLPAITPMSALEESRRDLAAGADAEPLHLERLELEFYPAEFVDDDRIIRPGWRVDLGKHGSFLVDATSGEIIVTPND